MAARTRQRATPNTAPRGARGARGRAQTEARPIDPRAALRTLRRADPTLGRAIDSIGRFGLATPQPRASSVYASIANAIVSQQLSGRAAATIYGRLCALFPGARGGPRPQDVLAAPDEALRSAGLSRAKALALRDLATRTLAGEIPTLAAARRLDDEAIIERLTAVRGVGRWTAQMFLIFDLGRPDVLPIDDYGVRKGFALAFGHAALPTPRALDAYGERWAPYRTVASWYLWRGADRGA